MLNKKMSMPKIIVAVLLVFFISLLIQLIYKIATYSPPPPAPSDWQHFQKEMDGTDFYYQKSNLHKDKEGHVWVRVKSVDPEEWGVPDPECTNCPSYRITISIMGIDCEKHRVFSSESRYYTIDNIRVGSIKDEPFTIKKISTMKDLEEITCKIK